MDLLYISNGNIPSRWAHSFQTMRMAEALARVVRAFRLVIATDLYGLLRPRVDLWEWYGIRQPFPVVRLPLWLKRPSPEFRKISPRRFIRYAVRYARLIRPRVVWTRSPLAAEGCLRAGLPVIFEIHSQPIPSEEPLFDGILSSPLLLGVVTNSAYLRDRYIERGIAPERAIGLPNGIDLDRSLRQANRQDLRRELGLSGKRPLAVYTGQLLDYKGIDTLLRAAARLPEVDFLLVGGWSDDIARWEKHEDARGNVRFVGFVPQAAVPRYQSAADICVLPNASSDPSGEWTCPLKLLEYMASGRPIIASALPAIGTLLQDGQNALLYPPDDSAGLAAAIERLLHDPALSEKLASQAFEDVRALTWDARAMRVLRELAPSLVDDCQDDTCSRGAA